MKIFLTLIRLLPHVACWSFVLVLPIGYYPDSPDSTDLAIGVHGGYGQVASVIRDCSGDVIRSEASSFRDVSGSAYLSLPPDGKSPLVLGVRGGYWKSGAGFAETVDYGELGPTAVAQPSFSYFNPNLSIETKYVGFGLGYVFGDVRYRFAHYDVIDYAHNSDPIRVSTHLRLGNIEKAYLAVSLAECTPLVSGGDILLIGVGAKVGRYSRVFSGLSALFYDRPGFVQQGRFRVSRRLDVDLILRVGEAGGKFEGAISGGVIYRFSLGQRTD